MSMIFIWLTLFVQSSWAFKISLLDSTLDLGAGMKSTTATVINDSDNPIAIEAGARLRLVSETGEETFAEVASTDLLIVPSQMIIPKNTEQVLNIRWVGDPIETEQAFRLLVEYVSISPEQLEGIAPDDKQANVVIQYRIAKSFYVQPKGAKSNLGWKDVSTPSVNDKDFLRFELQNSGTKHQAVHNCTVEYLVDNAKQSMTLTTEMLGVPFNVLAGNTRIVQLALPDVLKGVSSQDIKQIQCGE